MFMIRKSRFLKGIVTVLAFAYMAHTPCICSTVYESESSTPCSTAQAPEVPEHPCCARAAEKSESSKGPAAPQSKGQCCGIWSVYLKTADFDSAAKVNHQALQILFSNPSIQTYLTDLVRPNFTKDHPPDIVRSTQRTVVLRI